MVNWSGLAAQKYSILQQQADTASAEQRSKAPVHDAAAEQARMQTRLATGDSQAKNRYYASQGAFQDANTATIRAGLSFVGPRAQAGLDQILAQTGATNDEAALNRATAANTRTSGQYIGRLSPPPTPPLIPSHQGTDDRPPFPKDYSREPWFQKLLETSVGGQKRGLARVPGKGDGTKDTVHAMLAPGEAVLNKAAADSMGRGMIEMLNQKGAQKMGMFPALPGEDLDYTDSDTERGRWRRQPDPLLAPTGNETSAELIAAIDQARNTKKMTIKPWVGYGIRR